MNSKRWISIQWLAHEVVQSDRLLKFSALEKCSSLFGQRRCLHIEHLQELDIFTWHPSFFWQIKKKKASNSLASNLASLGTWQISPPPRANIRAREGLGIAVSTRLRDSRRARSPSVSFSHAREETSSGVDAAVLSARFTGYKSVS